MVEETQGGANGYPTHLQRLATSTVVVAVTPPLPSPPIRKGPKIKYIRKRVPLPLQKVGMGNKRRKTASGRFTK